MNMRQTFRSTHRLRMSLHILRPSTLTHNSRLLIPFFKLAFAGTPHPSLGASNAFVLRIVSTRMVTLRHKFTVLKITTGRLPAKKP